MAAPAPMARPAQSRRRSRRPLGGNSNLLARPQALVRPLAHLLILSLVLAGLPTPGQRSGGRDSWVEDVGGSEAGDSDLGGASPIDVELGPMLELGPALPPESPVKLDRAPLKLRTYTVKPGDFLSAIAERFELNIDTLIWANDVASPDLLQVGSK